MLCSHFSQEWNDSDRKPFWMFLCYTKKTDCTCFIFLIVHCFSSKGTAACTCFKYITNICWFLSNDGTMAEKRNVEQKKKSVHGTSYLFTMYGNYAKLHPGIYCKWATHYRSFVVSALWDLKESNWTRLALSLLTGLSHLTLRSSDPPTIWGSKQLKHFRSVLPLVTLLTLTHI